MQAYALQTYLKSLGHDVKIIDYKPDRKRASAWLPFCAKGQPKA